MTDDAWAAAKRTYPMGSHVTGTVDRVTGWGIFIAVEGIERYGVVADVVGMHHDPADDSVVIWPEAGEPVSGVVIDHMEHNEKLKLRLT